jgi:hypothetical protein
MIKFKGQNPIQIADALRVQSQRYKQRDMPVWKLNLARLSNDYEADLREEDRIFRRTGNRRFTSETKRRTGIHAVIALANPKMHHSIARQVMGARNFSAIPVSHKRNDRLRANATTQMLKARFNQKGGQDYETAYKLGLELKCALPGFMMVEGDRLMPRPRLLNQTESEKGDVRLAALPAWRVHWEPGVAYVDDWTYCMVDEYLSPWQINQRWPGPDNEEILGDSSIYTSKPFLYQDPLLAMETGCDDSLIQVSRIFVRPCLEYPNGAQWIIIGNIYVKKVYSDHRQDGQKWESQPSILDKAMSKVGLRKSKDLKNTDQTIGTPDKQIPLIRFGGLPSSPTTLGLGQMDIIGPLQRLANRKMTAYAEISNTTPDFHVLLPKGMSTERYPNDVVMVARNTQIGQAGFQIHPRPPLMPILDEIDWLDNKIDQLLNQPASARGEIPGTRTSGRTMQASQEFASVTEAPENAAFFNSMAQVAKRIVLEGREVWPDDFIFKAIGETRKTEFREFKLADLSSVVDMTVGRDDPWPVDKFQRARAIKEYATNGGFGDIANDPKAQKRMEDAMRLPNDEDDERHNQFQEQMIDQHMQALKKSEDVSISWACDDEYHIENEAEYLAEMVAEKDPKATPEYERRVALHINLHYVNMNRKSKWSNIGQLTDKAEEAIKGATTLANLDPAERLALDEVQGAEEPPGTLEAPPAPVPAPVPAEAAL